jgi:hypothetical protein
MTGRPPHQFEQLASEENRRNTSRLMSPREVVHAIDLCRCAHRRQRLPLARLTKAGFDTDGRVGNNTMKAVKGYQTSMGPLPAYGYGGRKVLADSCPTSAPHHPHSCRHR